MLGLRRLRPLWWRVIGSLWFVPSLAVAAAVLLAIGLVETDAWMQVSLAERWPRLFGAGHEGARGMLTAVASSMITVAGVVFSVTIVALSLAASQYSPRVLRNFSSDRPTQVVLGAFVAIFVYCLIVLRTIRGDDGQPGFVPSLAVFGGLLLALVGIGLLVYFIHHLAESIQASSILARVTRTTLEVIDDCFPDAPDAPEQEQPGGPADIETGAVVRARSTGYVVDVNMPALMSFACARGRVVCMEAQVGDFVVARQPLLSLTGDEPATDDDEASLVACYTLERQRTIEQDPAFGIQQIVDIGLKALSPGINDESTAILCIDRLTEVLIRLTTRRIERPLRRADGELRVIARSPSFAALTELAYHALRLDAQSKPLVLRRLLWSIGAVGAATGDVSQRRVLADQSRSIAEQARSSADPTGDFADVVVRAEQLAARLHAAP